MYTDIDKALGRVRGLNPGNYSENREGEQTHITPNGDGIICEGLPLLAEVVRLGDSWRLLDSLLFLLLLLSQEYGTASQQTARC